MKIGELARAARCTTETVRFYEKAGLLAEAGRTPLFVYDRALLDARVTQLRAAMPPRLVQ